MKSIYFLICIMVMASCSQPVGEKQQKEIRNGSVSSVEPRIFQVENGWGYDIYIDGKKTIHQPFIPSVPGNKKFTTEEDARKVASFVADKMRNHAMLPSISINELDSLKISY